MIHAAEDDVFFFGIVLQSQDFMGRITLDLGLYGETVVLFHIISVVYLWFASAGTCRAEERGGKCPYLVVCASVLVVLVTFHTPRRRARR